MTPQVIITEGPLRADSAARPAPGAGALIEFVGIVRPTEDGAPIEGLRYEAYRPMAEHQLDDLGRRTLFRFDILAIRVEHSVGFVPAGGASFRLQIASEHRKAALAAAEWFIDTMKQEVPIWKRAVGCV